MITHSDDHAASRYRTGVGHGRRQGLRTPRLPVSRSDRQPTVTKRKELASVPGDKAQAIRSRGGHGRPCRAISGGQNGARFTYRHPVDTIAGDGAKGARGP